MKIGYIVKTGNPAEKWKFKEAPYTRIINSRGDKIRSKMLMYPVDYSEIEDNAKIMKENPKIILVNEPFLLDDELREKAIRWCEWANTVSEEEYDPFLKYNMDGGNEA